MILVKYLDILLTGFKTTSKLELVFLRRDVKCIHTDFDALRLTFLRNIMKEKIYSLSENPLKLRLELYIYTHAYNYRY